MAFEKDPNEIGALWVKHGAKGSYMSGTVEVNGEKVRIVCFSAKKTSEKSPDWRVLKSICVPGSAPAPVQSPDSDEIGF